MKSTRKAGAILAAGIATTGMLSACSAGAPAGDAKVHLSVASLISATEQAAFDARVDKFNPSVLTTAENDRVDIFRIPREAYAIGLQYNLDLFTQAGLDPVGCGKGHPRDVVYVRGARMRLRSFGGWYVTEQATRLKCRPVRLPFREWSSNSLNARTSSFVAVAPVTLRTCVQAAQ